MNKVIVDEGAARVNYHTTEIRELINPLHRHFENAKKGLSFCQQGHTATLPTI